MTSVNLTVELPEEIEEKARAAGLLTSEKIAALIEAEVERQESWGQLFKVMHEVQAAARDDFETMTDDEFMDMTNEIVHEIRAKKDNAADERN